MKVLGSVFNARKNLIVEGNMLSGKTTNVMFPIVENIISKKEGFLVIDSKYEYINQYYNKLKENNYNIVFINIKDISKSNGWNPLTYPYKLFKEGKLDGAQEYLEKVSKMIYDAKSETCSIRSSADLFIALVFSHFEDAASYRINLNSIKYSCDLYNKKCGINDVLSEYLLTKDYNKKSYDFANYFLSSSKEVKNDIVSNTRYLLNYYTSKDDISILLNETNFDFDKINTMPTAIFLIGRDEDRELNRVLSMFIEQLYMILLDMKKDKFTFVLDNIDILDRFNDLNNILSSCTSRNIKTYLCTRSIDKLKKNYGEYITSLCDVLTINEGKVTLKTNDDFISEIKNFKNINIKKANVDYPELNDKTAYLFDLNKYLKESKKTNVINEADKIVNKIDNKINNIDIDKYIKKIDEKIKEIDEAENNDKSENKDIDYLSKNGREAFNRYLDELDEKITKLEEEEKKYLENKKDSKHQDKTKSEGLEKYIKRLDEKISELDEEKQENN